MPVSESRSPRPFILVNGQVLPAVEDLVLETSRYQCAGRFRIRSALAAASADVLSSVPLSLDIAIEMGAESAELMTGVADRISIDPITGSLAIEGRDLTALFIGAQVQDSFENQTASEIAFALAARHGLDTSITPTSTLVGRYFGNGRTRSGFAQHARAMTEWDLLCWLAQNERFDVWTSGRTLFFQPLLAAGPALSLAPGDCTRLSLHRALDLAAGVSVDVKSWDCANQTQVTASASTGGGSIRHIVRPNLSQADAQNLANRIAAQMSSHERCVEIEMPGDLVTTPRQILQLYDTGTILDGEFQINAVERHLSGARGYVQHISAGNLPWINF